MRLPFHRFLLTLTLAACVPAIGAQAARPTIEQQVEALRAKASQGAAKNNWKLAIHYLNEAQKEVRTARRAALYQGTRSPVSPAYREERGKLRDWLVAQEKLARAGKKSRAQVAKELKARQDELNRKHGVPTAGKSNSGAAARYDLLSASLDDSLAVYYGKKGNAAEAAGHRRSALVTRLGVYRVQGKADLAAQTADKLLATAPNDPEAYSVAGAYFQEKGQIQRASQIWQKGIRALESGAAKVRPTGVARDRTRTRNQYLGHFYRQQAFCYSKLGRATEATAAMRKAATFDGKPRG